MSASVQAVRTARGFDRVRAFELLNAYGVYAAIVVILIINVFVNPGFLSLSNLRVQTLQVVPTLMVALGMALVIGTEGVDLSVGAIIAIASSLIPLYLGYGAVMTIILALLIGGASGALSGSMVAVARVQPIVATLSLMIGLRGLAVIFNGASSKPVDDPLYDTLGFGTVVAGVPWMLLIGVLAVAVVAFVVRRTVFGRQLLAIGDNRAASQLAGLPVKRVLVGVYICSGLLSALAGVLLVGYNAQADPAGQGLNFELFAITAVVVGGTPLSGGKVKVVGTAAGAVLMQLITATLTQRNIPTAYAQIVQAVIIVLAVYAARGRLRR